ncbi:hypothetical protein Leryth_007364 [Lithospermum erythrorhizon]|nr:hypothetical protein Leryth_007364 [Lithospermum erythrorhizon]
MPLHLMSFTTYVLIYLNPLLAGVTIFADREKQEKFNKLMGVKGDIKVENKPDISDAEKEKIQLDLEKQYTAGLRRRDGRTVGLESWISNLFFGKLYCSCISFSVLTFVIMMKIWCVCLLYTSKLRVIGSVWIVLQPFLALTMPEFSLSWFLCSHCSVISRVGKSRVFSRVLHSLKMKLTIKKTAAVKSPVEKDYLTLLDLPDSILECILERLPSEGLNSMAGVSTALRNMCISDHLWEKHMKQKWGEVIGPAAYRKWLCYIATQKEIAILESKKRKMAFDSFKNIWPLFKTRILRIMSIISLSSVDSVMANGHVGFMLSCYDAEVFYDCHTNTFTARFHGRLVIEENIEWNRLRKPVIDSPPEFLHISSCLNDLKPNDLQSSIG